MSLWGENRGQSTIIGAIFVFGFIVAAIGANQAFLVPQANAEVEFKHSQDVQSDMVNLRSDILSAAGRNDLQSTSINLGPQYPTRYLAINPPEPAGTLSSTDAGTITANGFNLTSVCGKKNVKTDYLTYNVDYNERTAPPITYENSVVYRQTSGSTVFDSDQSLVNGNQIRLLPLASDFYASSTETTSIDIYPTNTGKTLVGESMSITFPSKLSDEQWENLIGSNDYIKNNGITEFSGKITIDFKDPDKVSGPNQYVVRCTYIGLEKIPEADPVEGVDTNNQTGNEFNPVTGIQYREATIASDSKVNMKFKNNLPNNATIYRARVPFYSVTSQGQAGASLSPPDEATIGETTLEITGPSEDINNMSISSNSAKTIDITFANTEGGGDFVVKEGDWYFLELTYKHAGQIESDRYLIVPEETGGGGDKKNGEGGDKKNGEGGDKKNGEGGDKKNGEGGD